MCHTCDPPEEVVEVRRWPSMARTAYALDTFHAGAALRYSIDDPDEWLRIETDAWDLVTDAFALDTADRNSRDRAKLIDASTLRAWVEMWKRQTQEDLEKIC